MEPKEPKIAASESRPCRVHLVDEASVVEHGERLRVWFVAQGEVFVKAAEHPNAELEAIDAADRVPPGVVWRRSIELLLPEGTLILSRVTLPRIERRDPLDYLTRGALGTHRSVSESYFRVLGNYRLEPTAFPVGR
jgi:hypothetical protein